mmetsp:Transcript_26163/g.66448  ORF Transcript_26163/g.66448 Transcript_26163/m.66448 type:complete len:212 (-) Transcript_26163:817-1452(-)
MHNRRHLAEFHLVSDGDRHFGNHFARRGGHDCRAQELSVLPQIHELHKAISIRTACNRAVDMVERARDRLDCAAAILGDCLLLGEPDTRHLWRGECARRHLLHEHALVLERSEEREDGVHGGEAALCGCIVSELLITGDVAGGIYASDGSLQFAVYLNPASLRELHSNLVQSKPARKRLPAYRYEQSVRVHFADRTILVLNNDLLATATAA